MCVCVGGCSIIALALHVLHASNVACFEITSSVAALSRRSTSKNVIAFLRVASSSTRSREIWLSSCVGWCGVGGNGKGSKRRSGGAEEMGDGG